MFKKEHIEKLRAFSHERWPYQLGPTHGVEHWDRVAKFAQILYVEGADMDVMQAFAYIHDAERRDNDYDIEHGKRASKLIDVIRHEELSFLNDEQIAKLKRACELHNVERRTGDLTIDICFDADRMDLPRVGIMPLPQKMATKQGAEIVLSPDYLPLYAELNPPFKSLFL